MEKKNTVVLVIGCIALILGLAGYVFSDKPAEMPPRVYFNTAGGPVLFPHKKHSDASQLRYAEDLNISKIQCADCHHELLKMNDVKSCDTCHPDDDYYPEDMDHGELLDNHPPSCTLCHNIKQGQARACGECHLKTGEFEDVSCDKCHPDEDYALDDFSHEELEEINEHWCTECHQTRRKTDAIHMQCNRCHNELNQGTYVKKDSSGKQAFACSLCHLKAH